MFTIISDPEVARFGLRPPASEFSMAEKLINEILRGFENKRFVQWLIQSNDDGRVIGTCTLWEIAWQHRRAEIGYSLAREYWGSGFATEAVAAMRDYAFDKLDLIRLEADVDPRNASSIRVLEKLGFQREGYMRARYIVNNEVQDSIVYGLVREQQSGG